MADTELATLKAHDLAQLAETAEGLLDQTLYVVKEGDQYVAIEKDDPKRKCVMKIFTPSTYADRQWPNVSVSRGGAQTQLEGCDAVFWREGAAVKLLWPYYHAQRLYDDKVAAIEQLFKTNASIAAVVHTFPSHPDTVDLQLLVQDGTDLKQMTLEAFKEKFKEPQQKK